MQKQNQVIDFKEIIDQTNVKINNGLNVHDHLKNLSIPELQEISRQERLPYEVMLLSLAGDLNISMMIRTACINGAEKVWVFGRRRYDKRGAVGAQNYIPIEQVYGFESENDLTFDVDKFTQICSDNNLVPIFVEQGGHNLGKFCWQYFLKRIYDSGKKPLIVMGNETNGIPQEIIDTRLSSDNAFVVSIPQRGVIRSFNVGVAMGIVVWDMRNSMGWL